MFKLTCITVNLARKDATVTSVTPCVAKSLCKVLIHKYTGWNEGL
jgi:hypothetical protein